ncbi:MAG: hypothetical protein HOI53_06035 [Francisellaceae bacterium]|jgi:hypothetical protein|nr:hypothetical protein [bacterium]MBT5015360.1 hypothetical protein [bacterium]MBT6207569.1 hypothetical protein [Francisellaceae bacterium]
MDYIEEKKKKGKNFLGNINECGYFIDREQSSDKMYGLGELLHESYSFYSDYYEEERFRKDYDNDCLSWGVNGVDVDSVGEDLLEIVPSYGTGVKTEEELERQKKHTIIVPRKALMEFVILYRCADREEWTTRRVEFDGKGFRLWLDGKEYTIDQDKLDRLEIYHKYGR